MNPCTIKSSTPVPVSQPIQRALIAVEASAFEAGTELVYQREHLGEFGRLDARRDSLVTALIGAAARGDVRTARALAPQIVAADRACDQAVQHVGTRRDLAHGHTRRIAAAIELTLTGRSALEVSL